MIEFITSSVVGLVVGMVVFRFGYIRGRRDGTRRGAAAVARFAATPEFIAQTVVHATGCAKCGPEFRKALDEAEAKGVPADHPDPKTGQYL